MTLPAEPPPTPDGAGAGQPPCAPALPRPRALLVRQGSIYGVMTLLDEPPASPDEAGAEEAAYELVLRLRPAPDSPLATLTTTDSAANRFHWLTPDRIASGRTCMQP